MIDFLPNLLDWVISFTDSQWAIPILGLLSFSEAVFFPIPPDPLLIAMAMRKPEYALWLAGIVTISSVTGALVGHWVGYKFGKPFFARFVSDKNIEKAETMFRKYGIWAVGLAAFTPIPYKVFAITAGILNHGRYSFLIASLIGRGFRFFLLGALIFIYGEDIEKFINNNFQILTTVVGMMFIVGLSVLFIVLKFKNSRRIDSPNRDT